MRITQGWMPLLVVVAFFPLHSRAAADEARREYERALHDADAALQRDEERKSCAGIDLVTNCGNDACEPERGETEISCAADCVPALVKSYNFQTLCRDVQRIHRPETVSEVQDAVRSAVSAGLSVRVVGRAHSANEQLCTPGIVISTERLNRVLGLESFHGVETVVTEPGVRLYELAEWLHARDRALGYSIIGFRGVSVAGAAATGSHGSSPKHSAVVSSGVESLLVVGADGVLREYSARNTEETTWRALRANLGMLGVVVGLRFRVQPQFNLHVKVDFRKDTALFDGRGVFGQIEGCDFGLINWFPQTGRFMRSCGIRTEAPAEPGAQNVLLDPSMPDYSVKPMKKVMQYAACHPRTSCLIERARYLYFKVQPPFQKTDSFLEKDLYTDDVIGPSHRMMSSHLTDQQQGFFQMDWEIAVPLPRAQAALEAVREHARKNRICLPLVGVFLRFAPAEDASLLAHTVALGDFEPGETVMFIEIPVYLPTAFPPEQKASYDRPYEDFARMLIERFSGRPHWGKNRDWALRLARDRDSYGANLGAFRQVAERLDPRGVFANEWSAYVGVSREHPLVELALRPARNLACFAETR